MTTARQALQLIQFTERLKNELRHSWTSTDRQESVADHSWRLSILVLVCSMHDENQIDLEKALTMAIVHDFPEILCGDCHYLEINKNKKSRISRKNQEHKAFLCLADLFGKDAHSLKKVWVEFETKQSYEARLVHFLDKIEVCIQHNQSSISRWTPYEVDSIEKYYRELDPPSSFSKSLLDLVVKESKMKLKKG